MASVGLKSGTRLLEIDLDSAARRQLFAGDEEFAPPPKSVARVAVGANREESVVLRLGLDSDSTVSLRLPGVAIDDDEVFELELRFLTGSDPLVLVSGPESIDRGTLEYLLIAIERTLRGFDLTGKRYESLGREIKDIGIAVLTARTRAVEQSVRDALTDEVFSVGDFAALQKYPERLAKVENAARQLGEAEPTWKSAQPLGRYGAILPPAADFFGKWLDEAEADAREAITRLSGLISSQQIVLTQRQAEATARFQRLVTIVGAAVLVPGLVAAIFGANVGFHGRESTDAFWAMLLFMAASGIATYTAIRALESGIWNRLAHSRALAPLAGLSDGARLALSGGLGAALLIAGVVFFTTAKSQGAHDPAQPTEASNHSASGNAKTKR